MGAPPPEKEVILVPLMIRRQLKKNSIETIERFNFDFKFLIHFFRDVFRPPMIFILY
jgi:hypothetical protein